MRLDFRGTDAVFELTGPVLSLGRCGAGQLELSVTHADLERALTEAAREAVSRLVAGGWFDERDLLDTACECIHDDVDGGRLAERFGTVIVYLPQEVAHGAGKLLRAIAAAGEGSFLAVLKVFGERPGAGLLSFPRPGATLALDFAQRGPRTERLFQQLDRLVSAAGGTLYPAKDAHMPPELFQAGYPAWRALEQRRDPAILSAFWQRVTGIGPTKDHTL